MIKYYKFKIYHNIIKMHGTLSHDDYAKLLNKMEKSYMPVEKKKKKMTIKQIFFLKNKYKKSS